MTLEVDFSGVSLPESLIWRHKEDGTAETSATATVLALESLAVGMPRLTAENARQFLERSTALSVARGAGPWVLRKNKSIQSTYLTWSQVRSFVGMRTNAADLSDREFGARLLEALTRTASRYADGAVERSGYRVRLTLQRLRPLNRLSAGDRRVFTGGKDLRKASRVIAVRVDTDLPDASALRAQAIDVFWSGDVGRSIVNRDHFSVEVASVERYSTP